VIGNQKHREIFKAISFLTSAEIAFTYGSAKSIGKAVSCIFDGELNPMP
jgi:hypothetical protein